MANKKCAYVRGEDTKKCPFGLPITSACKCAGDSVKRMVPVNETEDLSEEKKEEITELNRVIMVKYGCESRCIYADNIIEKFDKVDCDYGDTGAGMRDVNIDSSPLHINPLSYGVDGIYSYPLGMYSDNNESRNLFYALFSLLGHNDAEETLTKLATCVDNSEFILSFRKELEFLKKNYNNNKITKNSLELNSEDVRDD
jgi:hypothetical protein